MESDLRRRFAVILAAVIMIAALTGAAPAAPGQSKEWTSDRPVAAAVLAVDAAGATLRVADPVARQPALVRAGLQTTAALSGRGGGQVPTRPVAADADAVLHTNTHHVFFHARPAHGYVHHMHMAVSAPDGQHTGTPPPAPLV